MTEPSRFETPNLDLPLLTLRAIFFASSMGLALYLTQQAERPEAAFGAMLVAGLLAMLVILADALAVARSNIATVSAIVFGLLVGFLTAQLFVGIVSLLVNFDDPQSQDVLNGIRLATTLIFCYLGPAYLLRTKDDFRFIVPYVEFRPQSKGPRPLVLDTSAIIDGRVVELAAAGVFDAPFVVHRAVVEELQRIADAADKNRRVRGRRGLDKLRELQSLPGVEVELPQATFGGEVDRQLLELAKARAGRLVTVDYNLQKVAELEGVPVLNLNEVARATQPEHLPGDRLELKIVRPGEGARQGVGYLDDGTMVVVAEGRELKGQEVAVVVTKAIQSSAGRMVFARLASPEEVATQDEGRNASKGTPPEEES
ncbi:MAG: PIN/TRAM domain-containing protein [Planctomycetota bacterium]|nr:MAG: PIN/TRAM domain-containing protein [Planctomycetota bacterium]